MSKHLSQKQIDEMFLAYQEKQTVHYVSEKCHLSRQTVRRYRDEGKWDERLAEINEKAIIKVNAKMVTKRTSSIEIVNTAIDVWLAQAKGSLPVNCPYCGKQHEITIPRMKAQFRDLAAYLLVKEQLGGNIPPEPRKHTVELVRPSEERKENDKKSKKPQL